MLVLVLGLVLGLGLGLGVDLLLELLELVEDTRVTLGKPGDLIALQ